MSIIVKKFYGFSKNSYWCGEGENIFFVPCIGYIRVILINMFINFVILLMLTLGLWNDFCDIFWLACLLSFCSHASILLFAMKPLMEVTLSRDKRLFHYMCIVSTLPIQIIPFFVVIYRMLMVKMNYNSFHDILILKVFNNEER